MAKIDQKYEELVTHLKTQLVFLKSSSEFYDNGFEYEAQRLAASLRILFHNTNYSSSLFNQLNLEEKILILNTSTKYSEENLLSHMGLIMMSASVGTGIIYKPLLDENIGNKSNYIIFNEWWSKIIVLKDQKNNLLTRKDIICAVANQDGGSHVDPSLNQDYWELSRNNSLGWFYFDDTQNKSPDNNPVFASIRQIAYEVIRSFENRLQINISNITETDILSKINTLSDLPVYKGKIGRNMPCTCGNGKKYKNCCGSV